MNKIFLTSIVLITAVYLFIPCAFALGPATVYKVTVSTVQICKADSTCVTLSGTASTIDIASVSSGSVAGNFMSGTTVPDGIYTSVKVTPSPTFTISGSDTSGGTTYYTSGSVTNGLCDVTTVAASQAPCTITLTGANVPSEQDNTFPTPITVQNGVADHKIRVIFDVSQAVAYASPPGQIHPNKPTVTFSED